MFRALGLMLVTALSLGGAEAGKEVLESLLNSVLAVVQRFELVNIQKQLLVSFHQNDTLPPTENARTGPLYAFIRSRMTAGGRDVGLDYWASPYWFATGNFYRRKLDASRGEFAIGSPGPDRIAFTRDDIYIVSGGS